MYDMWTWSWKRRVYPVREDAVLYSVSYDLCEEVEAVDADERGRGREIAVDKLLFEACTGVFSLLLLSPGS
jgi:hypothetical protein